MDFYGKILKCEIYPWRSSDSSAEYQRVIRLTRSLSTLTLFTYSSISNTSSYTIKTNKFSGGHKDPFDLFKVSSYFCVVCQYFGSLGIRLCSNETQFVLHCQDTL